MGVLRFCICSTEEEVRDWPMGKWRLYQQYAQAFLESTGAHLRKGTEAMSNVTLSMLVTAKDDASGVFRRVGRLPVMWTRRMGVWRGPRRSPRLRWPGWGSRRPARRSTSP